MGNSESTPGEQEPPRVVPTGARDAHPPGMVRASPHSSNEGGGSAGRGKKEPVGTSKPARPSKAGDKLKKKAAAAVGLGGQTEAKKREEKLRAERRERRKGIPSELYIPSADSWGGSLAANRGSVDESDAAPPAAYTPSSEEDEEEFLFSPLSDPSDILNRLKKEEKRNAEQRKRSEGIVKRGQKQEKKQQKDQTLKKQQADRDAIVERQRRRLDELRNTPPPKAAKDPDVASKPGPAIGAYVGDFPAVEKMRGRARPINHLRHKDKKRTTKKKKKKSAVTIQSMFRRKATVGRAVSRRHIQGNARMGDGDVEIQVQAKASAPVRHNLRRMSMIDMRDVVDVGIPTTVRRRMSRKKKARQSAPSAKKELAELRRKMVFQQQQQQEQEQEEGGSKREEVKVTSNMVVLDDTLIGIATIKEASKANEHSDCALVISPKDVNEGNGTSATTTKSPFVDMNGQPFDLVKKHREEMKQEPRLATAAKADGPVEGSQTSSYVAEERKKMYSIHGREETKLEPARRSASPVMPLEAVVTRPERDQQNHPSDEKTPVPPPRDPFQAALAESDRALQSIERMSGGNKVSKPENEPFLAALAASDRALQSIERMSGDGQKDKAVMSRLGHVEKGEGKECEADGAASGGKRCGEKRRGDDNEEKHADSLSSSASGVQLTSDVDSGDDERPVSRGSRSSLNDTIKTPMVHLGALFADMSVCKPSSGEIMRSASDGDKILSPSIEVDEAKSGMQSVSSSPSTSENMSALEVESTTDTSGNSSRVGTTPAVAQDIFRPRVQNKRVDERGAGGQGSMGSVSVEDKEQPIPEEKEPEQTQLAQRRTPRPGDGASAGPASAFGFSDLLRNHSDKSLDIDVLTGDVIDLNGAGPKSAQESPFLPEVREGETEEEDDDELAGKSSPSDELVEESSHPATHNQSTPVSANNVSGKDLIFSVESFITTDGTSTGSAQQEVDGYRAESVTGIEDACGSTNDEKVGKECSSSGLSHQAEPPSTMDTDIRAQPKSGSPGESPELQEIVPASPDPTIAALSVAPSVASALRDVNYSVASDTSSFAPVAIAKKPDHRAVSSQAMDNASFLFGSSHMGRCRTSAGTRGGKAPMDPTRLVGTSDLSRRVSTDETKRGLFAAASIPAIQESQSFPAPTLPRLPSRPMSAMINIAESFDLTGPTQRLSMMTNRPGTKLIGAESERPALENAEEKSSALQERAAMDAGNVPTETSYEVRRGSVGSKTTVVNLSDDESQLDLALIQSKTFDTINAAPSHTAEDHSIDQEDNDIEPAAGTLVKEDASFVPEVVVETSECERNNIGGTREQKADQRLEVDVPLEVDTQEAEESRHELEGSILGESAQIEEGDTVPTMGEQISAVSEPESNLHGLPLGEAKPSMSQDTDVPKVVSKNEVASCVNEAPSVIATESFGSCASHQTSTLAAAESTTRQLAKANTFDCPATTSAFPAVAGAKSFDLYLSKRPKMQKNEVIGLSQDGGTPNVSATSNTPKMDDESSPLTVWTKNYPAITPMKTISPLERAAAARKKFGGTKDEKRGTHDDVDAALPSETMGFVMTRVTAIDGRLRRTRQPNRRNRRRETGGSGVLAPRKATLTNPAFRPQSQRLVERTVDTQDETLDRPDLTGITEEERFSLSSVQRNEDGATDNTDCLPSNETSAECNENTCKDDSLTMDKDESDKSISGQCDGELHEKNPPEISDVVQNVGHHSANGTGMPKSRDSLWIDEILGANVASSDCLPSEETETIEERRQCSVEQIATNEKPVKEMMPALVSLGVGASQSPTKSGIEEDVGLGTLMQKNDAAFDSASPPPQTQQLWSSEKNSIAGDHSLATSTSMLSTESEDIFANLAKQQLEMSNMESASVLLGESDEDEDAFVKLMRHEVADENSVVSVDCKEGCAGASEIEEQEEQEHFTVNDDPMKEKLLESKTKKSAHKVRWSLNDATTLLISPPKIGAGVYDAPEQDKENFSVTSSELRFSDSTRATVNPGEQQRTLAPPGSTSVLCLSPVQRTPLQARKWRTLAAAHAANKKDKPSAKKKRKNSAKKKRKMIRSS